MSRLWKLIKKMEILIKFRRIKLTFDRILFNKEKNTMESETIRQIRFFLSLVPEEYLIGIINNKNLSRDKLNQMLERIDGEKITKS